MNYDDEMKRTAGRAPGKESNSFQPLSVSDSDDDAKQASRPSRSSRSRTSGDTLHGPTAPQPPIKAVAPVVVRRGPTYPAWERPLTNQDFPKLRGREGGGRSLLPMFLAAVGVLVILAVVLGVPSFLGRVADLGAASGSPTTGASEATGASGSIRPSQSPRPSQSIVPSQSQNQSAGPAPVWTYKRYVVKSGDTPTGIAHRFGIQLWELEVANPTVAARMAGGHVTPNWTLNIPPPGVLTHPPAATPTPTDAIAP
jgi:hypothetical protein